MQVGCVSTPVGPDPSPDAEERKIIEKVSPPPNVTSQTISKLRAPKKPRSPTIQSLLGRGAENIQKLFGTPDFVRRDFGTQFWRYNGKDCLLNLAIYPQADGITYRVVHQETIDENGNLVETPLCIKQLLLKAQKLKS
jgi:hypothetical protein